MVRCGVGAFRIVAAAREELGVARTRRDPAARAPLSQATYEGLDADDARLHGRTEGSFRPPQHALELVARNVPVAGISQRRGIGMRSACNRAE